MYKMIAYQIDGEKLKKWFYLESKNPEFFNRYKNKVNYRIVIKHGKKTVYSEI